MFKLLIGLLLSGVCSQISASHSRGGTVSWKHLNSTGNSHVMQINFRIGWTSSYQCDDQSIIDRNLLYGGNFWYLNGSAVSLDFPHDTATICTTYSPAEDWFYGYNSFTAVVNGTEPFSIWFEECCWAVTYDWHRISTDVDFGVRSDTGKVNNPPVTFSPPTIRVTLGCSSTIRIVSSDEDGDRVECRYAVGYSECAGICGGYAHFTLNEETCTIDYDGGGGGFIPVALMLEDYPLRNITIDGNRFISTVDAISATPLQFAIDIVNPSTPFCNEVPSYPTNRIDNSNFTMPRNGTFNELIRARPGQPGGSIDRFIILGPLGLSLDVITYEGNDTFAANLTWTPDTDQSGHHDVCFYAVDNNGNAGEMRCFIITVAGKAYGPCELENGGCSDVCTATGSSHVCSCSDPCWELASDRKTCSPQMEIVCTGENVTIKIPNCATDNTVVAGPEVDYFSRVNCQSTPKGSDHYLSFGSEECGVQMEVSPVSVEYVISIWTWVDTEEGSGSSVITRGEWRRIPVTCSLSTSVTLSGSFVPILPLNSEFFPDDVSIDGMGSFLLFFEYYKNREYTIVYSPSDYPVEVTVNDEIFLSLGAVGRPGLEFMTEECVAKTSRVSTPSTLSYTFISNGCLLDTTITRHNTSSPMENRFSILAFEFEDKLLVNRTDYEIFLECQIILCDSTRNDTRCAKGCITPAGRRRRDIRTEEGESDDDDDASLPLQQTESPPQTVSSRFVFVIEGDVEEGPTGFVKEEAPAILHWALIGAGVALLGIVIFLSIIAVKYLRQKG